MQKIQKIQKIAENSDDDDDINNAWTLEITRLDLVRESSVRAK